MSIENHILVVNSDFRANVCEAHMNRYGAIDVLTERRGWPESWSARSWLR